MPSIVLSFLLLLTAAFVPAQEAPSEDSPTGSGVVSSPEKPQEPPTPVATEVGADWELQEPPTRPGPDQGSPSTPDRQRFWDELQARAFDDICRQIEIPVDVGFDIGQYIDVGAKLKRKLGRYPDGSLALIDEVRLRASIGTTEKLFEMLDGVPLNLSLQAGAEGSAYVIQPLGPSKPCKELKTMLKVWQFKTVVPVNERRIAGMAVGELWKLPLVLRARGSVGVGYPLGGPVSIGISLGAAQEEVASATLLRLSTDTIRLRLRIDKANVFDQSGSIVASLSAAEFFSLESWGDNIAVKEAERQLIREINRYLGTRLGISRWTRDGRKVLVEFVLDPNDARQVKALSEFLKGDLDVFAILMRIAGSAADPRVREGEPAEQLERIERDYVAKLGTDTTFAGVDDYKRKSSGFHFRLPIIYSYDGAKGSESDRIVAVDRDVELRINKATRSKSGAGFDIPLLGQIIKKNSAKSIEAFTRIDANGIPEAPMLVYIQQEGFIRHSELTAREMVEDVNDIARLAGVRGEGTNPRLELPVDAIFPKPKEPEPRRSVGERFDQAPAPAARTFRSATTAFTLILNRQAIQEILWASAETVVRAFVNALEAGERAAMQLVLSLSTIGQDGSLEFDRRAVDKALWAKLGIVSDDRQRDVWADIRSNARQAAGLVQDLLEARAGDWEARNVSLVRLVAGKGRSGLKFDGMMKVLVQLTDPSNLFAEFAVNTNKKIKGEKDVSSKYLFNKSSRDEHLDQAMRLKERFAEPSLLSD